jgi:hypothetical protein
LKPSRTTIAALVHLSGPEFAAVLARAEEIVRQRGVADADSLKNLLRLLRQ